MNVALNAYNALKAYKQAANTKDAEGMPTTAKWTQQYPEAWEFVSSVIKDRIERQRAQHYAG